MSAQPFDTYPAAQPKVHSTFCTVHPVAKARYANPIDDSASILQEHA